MIMGATTPVRGTPSKALTGMKPAEFKRKTGAYIQGRDAGYGMRVVIQKHGLDGNIVFRSGDKGATPATMEFVRKWCQSILFENIYNLSLPVQIEFYKGVSDGLRRFQDEENLGLQLKGIEWFERAVLKHWRRRPSRLRNVGDLWRWINRVAPDVKDHCRRNAVEKYFQRRRLCFAKKGRPKE